MQRLYLDVMIAGYCFHDQISYWQVTMAVVLQDDAKIGAL